MLHGHHCLYCPNTPPIPSDNAGRHHERNHTHEGDRRFVRCYGPNHGCEHCIALSILLRIGQGKFKYTVVTAVHFRGTNPVREAECTLVEEIVGFHDTVVRVGTDTLDEPEDGSELELETADATYSYSNQDSDSTKV